MHEAVLVHIREQAANIEMGELKTLSDVDYTVFPNETATWAYPEAWLSDLDDRYPEKVTYPGVLALHRELDLARKNGTAQSGDHVYLTARIWDEEGALEELRARGGITQATALHAGWIGLVDWVQDAGSGNYEGMAERKLSNFKEYRQLYPEYSMVFIGDSGQGDIDVARGMREDASKTVPATFIHNETRMSKAERDELAGDKIFVFDNCAEAAFAAYAQGLLDGAAVYRVLEACQKDLKAIKFDNAGQRRARQEELDATAARIEAAIPRKA